MKINKLFLGVVSIAALFTSCGEELDYHEYDNQKKDYIEKNFAFVDGLVSNIYSQLDYDYGDNYGGGMLASACDEAVYCNTSASINYFTNGAWSPTTPQSVVWTSSYAAIADCNNYLANFMGLTFPEEKNKTDYALNYHQYERSPYEVKLLRAYFYFLLVRQYGDVPYYTKELTAAERNALTRTPAHDVLDSIMTTCDEVKEFLPEDYTNLGEYTMAPAQTGRFNKMCAIALKARAAMYAASPLFDKQGQGNDAAKWKIAADACKELIDVCTPLRIRIGYYERTWGETNYQSGAANNAELIYARRVNDYGTPESRNYPVGIKSAGAGGNCPSETLAEAFETKNGYDVILTENGWKCDDPKFDPTKPFANRDPRFALIFACNGDTKWPTSNADPLEIYYGGTSGEPKVGASPTGYYLKKLLDGNVDLSSTGTKKTSKHSWMTFRLGEFYLNYAEALFKWQGSYTAKPEGHTMNALDAVNQLRNRTRIKMPLLTATNVTTNEQFWEKYKKERFAELCFEGHRFYDIRRWKEPVKTVKLLKMTKNEDGSINYRLETKDLGWEDKMYFFPIPLSDIIKSGGALTQNEGW